MTRTRGADAARAVPARTRAGTWRRLLRRRRPDRHDEAARPEALASWLEAVFVSSPVALAVCTEDDSIDRANVAMAGFLGYPGPDILIGTTLSDHLVPTPASGRRSTRSPADLTFRRADGTSVHGRVTRSTLDGPIGHRLTLLQVQDISDSTSERAARTALAEHDPLTGLLNRQGLLDAIEHDLADPGPSVCCLLLVNIDRLNSINHALGHLNGDRVLEAIAERLRMATRVDDVLCRLGGDQFAVLLRRPAAPSDALTAAERLLALSREQIDVSGRPVIASVSIGISRSRSDSTVESLLREADVALMEAKAGGRNRYEIFDDVLRDAVESRSRLEGELRLALNDQRLELQYQPEVDLLTGEVMAVEALVRWPHPVAGLLSADQFVPLAEQTGMVTELGDWVLRTACTRLASWSDSYPLLAMRVNVSALQLARPELVDEVRSVLAESGVEPMRLCLELTETAVMADAQRSIEVLTELAELGVRLAIDDFGTGFSSLAHLQHLPAHVLKIDRSFVAELEDTDGEAIVRAVVGLAGALDLDVVAEGVETQAQRDLLLSLGCRRAQGHLFAGALPESDLMIFLQSCG